MREFLGQIPNAGEGYRIMFDYAVGRLLSEAVNHVHAHGYVHGDVNESNVIITAECLPVLIDFELTEPAIQEGRRGCTQQ